MVQLRNTPGALLEEVEREVGSSYEATVCRKLEDGNGQAYVGALRKFLRFSRIPPPQWGGGVTS